MLYDLESMFSLSGEVAIITGATGGIGREIAYAMGKLGAKLALVGTNNDKLTVIEKEFSNEGLEMMSISLDITNKKEVQEMSDAVFNKYGKIDILVNCAGISYLENAIEFREDMWERVIDVNLKGTFFACQAVGKYMVEQNKGRIVNISSVRGLQGRAEDLAYAPSKGAVNLLTKSLAIEWAKKNINVNAVAPVFTLTNINKNILEDKAKYNWILSRIPKGRLCSLENIVGPTIFLCSPSSEFVTGHILYVDGGWTAS